MVNLLCDLAVLAYTTLFQEHVHSVPCCSARLLYSTRKHVLYSYIVQQANTETEQNDANNDTRSKRLDIGRSMGGWLQETGQWPQFNKDGHPQPQT